MGLPRQVIHTSRLLAAPKLLEEQTIPDITTLGD